MKMVQNLARMTRECYGIFLNIISVLENPSKVKFSTSKLSFECFHCIFWTSMSIFDSPTAYHRTSMPIRNWRALTSIQDSLQVPPDAHVLPFVLAGFGLSLIHISEPTRLR